MSKDRAATPANRYQPFHVQCSPRFLADDTKDQGDTAAGEHGACRQTNCLVLRKVSATDAEGAGEDGDEDGDRDPEIEGDLAQHVDGDDDAGQMQARITQAGQHDRIIRSPQTNGARSWWSPREGCHIQRRQAAPVLDFQ